MPLSLVALGGVKVDGGLRTAALLQVRCAESAGFALLLKIAHEFSVFNYQLFEETPIGRGLKAIKGVYQLTIISGCEPKLNGAFSKKAICAICPFTAPTQPLRGGIVTMQAQSLPAPTARPHSHPLR